MATHLLYYVDALELFRFYDASDFRETFLRSLKLRRSQSGLNAPFDPVASELAARIGLTVKMIRGRSVRDVERAIAGEPFKGTMIGD
jgi:uridylate kinase